MRGFRECIRRELVIQVGPDVYELRFIQSPHCNWDLEFNQHVLEATYYKTVEVISLLCKLSAYSIKPFRKITPLLDPDNPLGNYHAM